jgi:hypothetical protein
MKIELSTPIKNITFSDETRKFWKEKILAKFEQRNEGYSWFKREDKFSEWGRMVSDGTTIGQLLTLVASFYRSENGDFQYNQSKNVDSSSYLSVQMINLLGKDKVDLTQILLDNYNYEPKDYKDWHIKDFFNLYLDYLNLKEEKISDILSDTFISNLGESKKYSSHRSVDDDLSTYFQLLKVTPSEKINYDWFSKQLEFFCLIEDDDSRELENHCKYLNYDSQKKIHNYVKQHFPNNVDENSKYYPELLVSEVFSTKRLHQGCIDINIFSLIQQYGLTNKDVRHLSSIACECLNVVASDEFMKLIGENIQITNIENKEHKSSVTLNFSTDTYENLEKAEKIILTALKAVLEVSQKIRINWSENYHTGADELSTNMNAKFVHQYYMYHNLNDSLDTNSSKPKRNKI